MDGIEYFTGGPEDMAQSMGLPGEHTHPKVQEAFEVARDKIYKAGKKWFGDHTDEVHAVMAVKEAAEKLLAKYNRISSLAL